MFDNIPYSAVIVLAGVAGSGKSTFAREHFPESHVLSSDAMRGVLTDDTEHRECSKDAFAMLEALADLRLSYGRRAVIDATNLRPRARRPWLELAKKHDVPAILIYLDVPPEICARRQVTRERKVPLFVIARQHELMQDLPEQALEESWDAIGRMHTGLGELEGGALKFEAVRPFELPRVMRLGNTGVRIHDDRLDVVGDVHGCKPELLRLMKELGWGRGDDGRWAHPEGRMLVFVGDLTDRGPDSLGVLDLVATLVEQEQAVLILGNHDDKLKRYLMGRNVKATHGLETTVAEFEALAEVQRETLRHRYLDLLERAPLFALCDPEPHSRRPVAARLVVAHAAWKPELLTRSPGRARSFCIYGPTTGRSVDGLPERLDWTIHYPPGSPTCVHGHTAFDGHIEARNNTICVDTGCVYGGNLSALRWPSRQIVQVPALKVYYDKALAPRPRLLAPAPDEGPGQEAEAAAALGVGPDVTFELRIDGLLARLHQRPAATLEAVDRDRLLLKKEPEGFGGAEVRLANASRDLFSPQAEHHLYAKGLVYATDPLRVLSVPYLKMYNYGEREDARALANALAASDEVTVRFNDKLDGSLIQSFSTRGHGVGPERVVITTRGMIEGATVGEGVGSGGFNYIGAARELMEAQAPAALDPARVEGLTLLWELIHPDARVVTDYGDREAIVLTGAVDFRGAPPRYLPREELEALAEDLGCPIAAEMDLGGGALADQLQRLEAYLAGTDREGAVLTFEGEDRAGRQAVLHRVKVKGADYLRIMRQLTYCTYDRTRAILDQHPQIRSWPALRDYLIDLGSDEVPEEVLSAYRAHLLTWQAYEGAARELADEVQAFFEAYAAAHPMPERESTPKAYGHWRRDFAHVVKAHAGDVAWLLFLAADGKMSFDGLNKKLRGDQSDLDAAREGWEAVRGDLEAQLEGPSTEGG